MPASAKLPLACSFAAALAALPQLAPAVTANGGVEGRATVHQQHSYGNRKRVQIGSQHVSVPATHAGVGSFKVKMPWGGHVVSPGVHVRSPRVGVTSPRVGVKVPFSGSHARSKRRQAHR